MQTSETGILVLLTHWSTYPRPGLFSRINYGLDLLVRAIWDYLPEQHVQDHCPGLIKAKAYLSRLSGSSSLWNHLFHTRDHLSRWSHLLQHRNHLFQTRDYLSLHQDHLPGTKPRLICQGYQGLSVPLESSVPTSELSVLNRDYLSPGVICSNQDHFPTSIISHYQDHFPII